MELNDLKKSESESEFYYYKKINQYGNLISKKNYNLILPNLSHSIREKIKKSKEEDSEDPVKTPSKLFISNRRLSPVCFPTECKLTIGNEAMEI